MYNISQVHLKLMKFPKKKNNLSIRKEQCQDYFGKNVKNKLSKSKDTYHEYLIHFEIET